MKAYRYTECGLDTVLIEDVNVAVDDAGEQCVSIPNVKSLHKLIACGIVHRRTGMTGLELRFLRTEMGMTQAELAEHVHREPLAVSRWERGEVPVIDSNAEALIRLLAVEKLKLPEASVAEITGWCVQSASTPPLIIDGSDPTNYRLKDAA